MNSFQEYIRKEIAGLINHSNDPFIVNQRHSNLTSKSNTLNAKTISHSQRIFWETYTRDVNKAKNSYNDLKKENSQKPIIKRSKSAFYRDLLKAEQSLNTKAKVERPTSVANRRRIQSRSSNSTRRRHCLESHIDTKKIEDLPNLKLMNRQSSCNSEIYLKAKLQYQHRRSASSFGHIKIIKI